MTTKLDVAIGPNAWTNIHTASSLAAGVAVIVQSKSANGAIFFVGMNPPLGKDGMAVAPNDYSTFSIALTSSEYLFARSAQFDGTIGVQV